VARVLVVSGSPAAASRSGSVASSVATWLGEAGHAPTTVHLRDLPADDLVHLRADAPRIAETVAALAASSGLVLTTPVYKAAYSGLLKTWLDLLPQHALAEKVVLPITTGGSAAHVLALDYALRPVLQSMWPKVVLSGWHVLESHLAVAGDGAFALDQETEPKLRALVADLVRALEAP
jgi:FMN reductase